MELNKMPEVIRNPDNISRNTVAHEVLPVRNQYPEGIKTPRWSWGIRAGFKEHVRYDKAPMFADFLDIPVQDIHSLLFGVLNYGQADMFTLSGSAKFLQFGWTCLGSGRFSHVYQHKSSDKVFKVCNKGDSTLLWLEFCKVNKGKQGLPNVHAVYKNGKGYVAVLDKLVSAFGRDEICEYARFRLAQCIFNQDPLSTRCNQQEIEDNREFIDVLQAFMKWLPCTEYTRVDFHSGNAMFTQHGEVVITDPII